MILSHNEPDGVPWQQRLWRRMNREFWDFTAFVDSHRGTVDQDAADFLKISRKGFMFAWEIVQANPPADDETWSAYLPRLQAEMDREERALIAEAPPEKVEGLKNGIARAWRTIMRETT